MLFSKHFCNLTDDPSVISFSQLPGSVYMGFFFREKGEGRWNKKLACMLLKYLLFSFMPMPNARINVASCLNGVFIWEIWKNSRCMMKSGWRKEQRHNWWKEGRRKKKRRWKPKQVKWKKTRYRLNRERRRQVCHYDWKVWGDRCTRVTDMDSWRSQFPLQKSKKEGRKER